MWITVEAGHEVYSPCPISFPHFASILPRCEKKRQPSRIVLLPWSAHHPDGIYLLIVWAKKPSFHELQLIGQLVTAMRKVAEAAGISTLVF